jgi:hypothetical protein
MTLNIKVSRVITVDDLIEFELHEFWATSF